MRNFISMNKWKRRLSQLAFLTILGEWSFYGVFRCPYAVPYLGCGSCPVIQCPGRSLWMWGWLALISSALVFGRSFCGWACPGGLAADLLAALSPLRIQLVKSITDRLAYLKLGLLAATLYFFFILHNPRWAIPIRTGEFFQSVGLTFEHANQLWLYKTTALLAIFVIGGLIIPRLWCRFLCPTGGLLDLFNKFALVRVKVDSSCNGCQTCKPGCSMDTTPGDMNCTNCGTCLELCPQKAPAYSNLRSIV